MKPSTRGLVLVTLAACSWGTYSLFLRPTGLPATTTAPILFLAMGLVTLPAALRQPPITWDRTSVLLLLGNVVFDALNVITFFAAMSHTTVAIAVLTHYVAPIIISLAAPLIEGTPASRTGPPALVALAGLVVILEPWSGPTGGATVGALLGVTSAFCYAGNTFVLRRLGVRIGAARSMSYHSLLAAVLVAPLLWLDRTPVEVSDLALVVGAGALLGAGTGIMFIRGLALVGSARAAVLTFAEPLVAVAVGALVWGEPLSPLAAVGGALVLASGIHVARTSGTPTELG